MLARVLPCDFLHPESPSVLQSTYSLSSNTKPFELAAKSLKVLPDSTDDRTRRSMVAPGNEFLNFGSRSLCNNFNGAVWTIPYPPCYT